jgi:hypothetical protein
MFPQDNEDDETGFPNDLFQTSAPVLESSA